MTDALKLYNQDELAAIIGVSSPTVSWWVKREVFPEPYATYGKKNHFLWTEDQVEKCKEIYMLSRKNVKGVYAEGAKKTSKLELKADKQPEEESKVVLAEDGLTICAECSAPVFNLQVHNDFAHKGRLSVVGRNG